VRSYEAMAALDAPPPALPPSMLASLADGTLVGLIAAGSDDAFAALDARYRRRLVRYARTYAGGGTADAEDAVQDALVRAVRALRRGSRPDAVGPWLHRIARNCALDLAAARRRHPVVELADHAHAVAEDAAATVERRLGMRGLVADVGELPATQRSALLLRELEGRSYADIADELDVTVPAVKSLLVRARQGLKRAREQARVAAWLPMPLLARAGERVSALWEPVAATATPKVACVAVVLAGSVPVLAETPVVSHHAAPPAARSASPQATRRAAAPATPPATRAISTPAAQAGPPAGTGGDDAAGLRADCRDGTIDRAYGRAMLTSAYSGAEAGEYYDCRRALAQAIL